MYTTTDKGHGIMILPVSFIQCWLSGTFVNDIILPRQTIKGYVHSVGLCFSGNENSRPLLGHSFMVFLYSSKYFEVSVSVVGYRSGKKLPHRSPSFISQKTVASSSPSILSLVSEPSGSSLMSDSRMQNLVNIYCFNPIRSHLNLVFSECSSSAVSSYNRSKSVFLINTIRLGENSVDSAYREHNNVFQGMPSAPMKTGVMC